jgi:hypothetical protein
MSNDWRAAVIRALDRERGLLHAINPWSGGLFL